LLTQGIISKTNLSKKEVMKVLTDSIQRFLVNRMHIRGEIVRLRHSYLEVVGQTHYPHDIQQILGEILASSVLLSATIKFKGSLIIQIQNTGPLEFLVAHCNDSFHIHGLAKWQTECDDFSDMLDTGTLAISILSEPGDRYQGIVELTGTDLATALEKYFTQSEQLDTLLLLSADLQSAGGILLQKLPNHSPMDDEDKSWDELRTRLKEIRAKDLLQSDPESLIHYLFEQEDVVLYDAAPVEFQCTCSEERSANAIRTLSPKDVEELLLSYKQITVTCEFCNHSYHFNASEVANILA
jgi:molecular chaperone Hsp33